MTRVLSARLDEAACDQLDRLTRRLGMTKKQFLEEAIRLRADQVEGDLVVDVWAETSGAWRRSEKPEATVRRGRRAFRRSLERHHGRHARLRR